MMKKALSFAVVAALALGTMERPIAGQAKPFSRITEQQAQAALKTANDSAKGNYDDLMRAFEKEVKKLAPDYDNDGFKVYERAELMVTLYGPAQMLISTAQN